MKRVLVTGAGGTIGLQVIRFLLSEGKYEVTAFDIKSRNVYDRLKTYRKRIDIVYGDINDIHLVDSLIKENDVVIHLAGVLPPQANVVDDLCEKVDYGGTRTVVNSIKKYNPECFLLYASSTSVYGFHEDYKNLGLNTKCEIDDFDFYSKYKLECENYIKDNIKNYSIFRLAYVLGDPKDDNLILNVNPMANLETVSSEDAGYAFSCAIDNLKLLKGKTFNLSGGEKFRTRYKDYCINVLRYYGLSFNFLSNWIFAEKNYFGGYYDDGNELEEILNFRSKNLDVYYDSLEKYKNSVWRLLPRLFGIPFIMHYKKSRKDV